MLHKVAIVSSLFGNMHYVYFLKAFIMLSEEAERALYQVYWGHQEINQFAYDFLPNIKLRIKIWYEIYRLPFSSCPQY